MTDQIDPDIYVKNFQFTKTTYRDVYPAIDPTLPTNSQEGKVVVITGASKGIGRMGFAKQFAKAGAKGLVLVARGANTLEEVKIEVLAINPNIEVLTVSADLKSAESIAALWEKVREKFGKADVLINNAGSLTAGTIVDTPIDIWWNDFETNIRGAFLQIQGFLKLLGKEDKGTIINVTSVLAIMPVPSLSSYTMSKMAVIQMQAFVAAENPNVTAVALHPGTVLTDMTGPAFVPYSLDTPELAGGVGVWLCTEKASFLNGKYVDVNWSVDELMERKGEILEKGRLSIGIKGEFGIEHFQ
ncbi:putative oxidoreductase ucpA [Tricladium varicosporioides]|nr:putative oxidoreductase ucpA [Hymenoscyphus varicosporioides]